MNVRPGFAAITLESHISYKVNIPEETVILHENPLTEDQFDKSLNTVKNNKPQDQVACEC